MLVTDNLTSSYTTTVQGAQLKRIFIFYGSSELHMENIPCDALLQKLHADYWETQSEAQVSHLSRKNCSSTQTEYKAPA